MRKLLDYQEISSIWNNLFVLQGTSDIIKTKGVNFSKKKTL